MKGQFCSQNRDMLVYSEGLKHFEARESLECPLKDRFHGLASVVLALQDRLSDRELQGAPQFDGGVSWPETRGATTATAMVPPKPPSSSTSTSTPLPTLLPWRACTVSG